MDSVETKGISEYKREKLREAGFDLEYLGQAYWNVSCETERVDEMTSLLDALGIEWRLV